MLEPRNTHAMLAATRAEDARAMRRALENMMEGWLRLREMGFAPRNPYIHAVMRRNQRDGAAQLNTAAGDQD